MPTKFSVPAEGGGFVEADHYSLTEVAAMFRVSYSTAQRDVHRRKWPHMYVAHRMWFSEGDIAAIWRLLRPYDGPDALTDDHDDGPALGLVMPPEGDNGRPVIR